MSQSSDDMSDSDYSFWFEYFKDCIKRGSRRDFEEARSMLTDEQFTIVKKMKDSKGDTLRMIAGNIYDQFFDNHYVHAVKMSDDFAGPNSTTSVSALPSATFVGDLAKIHLSLK